MKTNDRYAASSSFADFSQDTSQVLSDEELMSVLGGDGGKDARMRAIFEKATEGATEAYTGMFAISRGHLAAGFGAAIDGLRRMYFASQEANELAEEERKEEEAREREEQEAEDRAAGGSGSGGASMMGTGGPGGMSGYFGGNAHNHQTQSERNRTTHVEIIDLPQMTGS